MQKIPKNLAILSVEMSTIELLCEFECNLPFLKPQKKPSWMVNDVLSPETNVGRSRLH